MLGKWSRKDALKMMFAGGTRIKRLRESRCSSGAKEITLLSTVALNASQSEGSEEQSVKQPVSKMSVKTCSCSVF